MNTTIKILLLLFSALSAARRHVLPRFKIV